MPTASPRPTPAPPSLDELTFYDALREVAAGKKITRTAWSDPTVCLFLHGGALHLRKADGTLHTLIVQDGDLEAIDWVVVREQ